MRTRPDDSCSNVYYDLTKGHFYWCAMGYYQLRHPGDYPTPEQFKKFVREEATLFLK